MAVKTEEKPVNVPVSVADFKKKIIEEKAARETEFSNLINAAAKKTNCVLVAQPFITPQGVVLARVVVAARDEEAGNGG